MGGLFHVLKHLSHMRLPYFMPFVLRDMRLEVGGTVQESEKQARESFKVVKGVVVIYNPSTYIRRM